MPVLYVLAGPNGTGKTTFYNNAVQDGIIPHSVPFVNVDLIAQALGGYTEENYAKAPEIYRECVKEHLRLGENFMIESNLAKSRNHEWILSMKKAGYEVELYYLSTDDVEINIRRVKRRVAEGGHDIPEAILRSRYTQSHSYLKTGIREFTTAYLIDNTYDLYRMEAKVESGRLTFKSDDAQPWVRDVLSLVERLSGRR